MNRDEYLNWVYATEEHINCLNRIIEDRKLLKRIIETHLKEFFKWDSIEYNRDFSVITLSYRSNSSEIIKSDKLDDLLMDFEVKPSFNGVDIILYPFGVPNEEGEV